MNKKITKEQIVNTTLELIRNKNHLRQLNFREIARNIGCAHTNLYNYFQSYQDLLWEAYTQLEQNFTESVAQKITETINPEFKLRNFFNMFLEFYLQNKGWFRLAWLDYIGENRPERHRIITEKNVSILIKQIMDIWKELYDITLIKEDVKRVLHNTHCYIIGEVSNYISGRGIIEEEIEFKEYVIKESVNILTLSLRVR